MQFLQFQQQFCHSVLILWNLHGENPLSAENVEKYSSLAVGATQLILLLLICSWQSAFLSENRRDFDRLMAIFWDLIQKKLNLFTGRGNAAEALCWHFLHDTQLQWHWCLWTMGTMAASYLSEKGMKGSCGLVSAKYIYCAWGWQCWLFWFLSTTFIS